MRWIRVLQASTLLFLGTSVPIACCQKAAQQYKAAQTILKSHSSEDGILNDDSQDARTALSQMWEAAGQAVIEVIRSHRNATPQQIDDQLCKQGIAAAGCDEAFSPQHDVVPFGDNFYAIAVATQTGGTVLIVGDSQDKPTQLWSLDKASVTRKQDPQDLIGAWHPDRTGIACRKAGSPHKPGSCGPLYSDLGLLPPDAQGRPRFYIDAGYEQPMGATIGKQTSLWRWDGDHAELLWVNFYNFMIDQAVGTSFDNDKGTLHIAEKGELKTMFSCGSCIDRPLDQSILITKTGFQDLVVRSLAPELDRIDDLFSRLQESRPTTGIASLQVTSFLKKGIAKAKQASRKIDPDWFSMGMIGSSTVKLTSTGADVCLATDNDYGPLHFSLRRTTDGGYFIEHVAVVLNNAGCERGLFLPTPQPTSAKE